MTPERKAEVQRTSQLFHIALVQLGAKSMQDALSLWEDVPPLPPSGTARATEAWLQTAIKYVMQRRLRARDLALAYYRYERALTTGTTIALPGQENPPSLDLFELKREFEAVLNPTGPELIAGDQVDDETQAVSEAPESPANEPEDDEDAALLAEEEAQRAEEDRILVEILEGLEEDMAEAERQAEVEIERALKALGPSNLTKKMDAIDPASPVEQVDEDRRQAHRAAGNRQAATAAREAMNGARGPLYSIGDRDARVIGFARVSRTGTPCGWCAMLISRGFVVQPGREMPPGFDLYRGSQGSSATTTYGDLDLYHDNCQCYAVPIFDSEQMSSELFELNRKYAELWPIVTKGLGGKRAISKWRSFIRNQAKSQAQEAAA